MNTSPFRTLGNHGESEHTVDRSRFMGHALPIDSLEEAQAFVEEIRSTHYDARHVCFGLRLGRGAQGIDRSNDDGEPARTGGFPLWQLLDGEEITDALIVVVRYFGGIKLGMGGLARAYREAGRLALEQAGTITVHPETTMVLKVSYDLIGKLKHIISAQETIRIQNIDYAEGVTFNLAVRSAALDEARVLFGGFLQCDPSSITVLDASDTSEKP